MSTQEEETKTPVPPYELTKSPPPETHIPPHSPAPTQAYPREQQQQPQIYPSQPEPVYTTTVPLQQPMGIYQPQAVTPYLTAIPIANLTKAPSPVDCPVCGQRELTRVTYESGGTTHAWACILCFCFGLGCVPYMMESLKDVVHRCGRCGVALATWHRSGWLEVHQRHGQQQQQQQASPSGVK